METNGKYILILANHHEGKIRIAIDLTFMKETMEIILQGLECKIIEIEKS